MMVNTFIFNLLKITVLVIFLGSLINIAQTEQDCGRGNFDSISTPFNFKNYYGDKSGTIWGAGGSGEISVQSPEKELRIIKLPTESDFNDIYFFDRQIGFVVGTDGSIFKTVDLGETWVKKSSNNKSELNEIFCVSETKCWIVGKKGTALRTENGGNTWERLKTNTTNDLLAISFADHQVGWVVGRDRIVLKTNDGGDNWVKQSINKLSNGKSTEKPDGGWLGIDNSWRGVNFINVNHGCITGLNKIACTNNGGEEWTLTAFHTNKSFRFINVSFESDKIRVLEKCGKDFTSSDFGQSWVEEQWKAN
jgi:photosystem II stability/assembly factor-like uncharacterized protein